jgi:hypothetical protein
VTAGETGADVVPAAAESDVGQYVNDPDVNAERMKHDLPLTIETGNGRGGKIVRRQKVKGV